MPLVFAAAAACASVSAAIGALAPALLQELVCSARLVEKYRFGLELVEHGENGEVDMRAREDG